MTNCLLYREDTIDHWPACSTQHHLISTLTWLHWRVTRSQASSHWLGPGHAVSAGAVKISSLTQIEIFFFLFTYSPHNEQRSSQKSLVNLSIIKTQFSSNFCLNDFYTWFYSVQKMAPADPQFVLEYPEICWGQMRLKARAGSVRRV